MKKFWRWLLYILPVVVILAFRRARASTESTLYFLEPGNAQQKEDFLTEANRPDWNDDDCMAAKNEIEGFLLNHNLRDLITYSGFYYRLIDADLLMQAREAVGIIYKRLSDEESRREKI